MSPHRSADAFEAEVEACSGVKNDHLVVGQYAGEQAGAGLQAGMRVDSCHKVTTARGMAQTGHLIKSIVRLKRRGPASST